MSDNQPAWGRAMTIEQALFFAQECRCFYCGNEFEGPHVKRNRHTSWTRDHLNPAEGGHGRTRNLVLACGDCNSVKANTPPTVEQLERAAIVHVKGLRLLKMFNGAVPPEWHGTRAPHPTQREQDRECRREMAAARATSEAGE